MKKSKRILVTNRGEIAIRVMRAATPRLNPMRVLGDKASARRVAVAAGVPVIPATEVLGDNMELVKRQAADISVKQRCSFISLKELLACRSSLK